MAHKRIFLSFICFTFISHVSWAFFDAQKKQDCIDLLQSHSSGHFTASTNETDELKPMSEERLRQALYNGLLAEVYRVPSYDIRCETARGLDIHDVSVLADIQVGKMTNQYTKMKRDLMDGKIVQVSDVAWAMASFVGVGMVLKAGKVAKGLKAELKHIEGKKLGDPDYDEAYYKYSKNRDRGLNTFPEDIIETNLGLQQMKMAAGVGVSLLPFGDVALRVYEKKYTAPKTLAFQQCFMLSNLSLTARDVINASCK